MITRSRLWRLDAELMQHRSVRLTRSRRPCLVPVPWSPLLADALPRVDWSDAYAVPVSPEAPCRDAQEWADAVFHAPPLWVRALFGLRELLVGAVGIERGGAHVFDTVSRRADEVLLGVDQAHLSFRASVLVERDRVVVTTLVALHNRRGAAYSALVRRVHPLIVRTLLARAAQAMAGPAPPTTSLAVQHPCRPATASAPSNGARSQEN